MLRHVIVEELEATIAALKDNVTAFDARLASLGRQLEACQATRAPRPPMSTPLAVSANACRQSLTSVGS